MNKSYWERQRLAFVLSMGCAAGIGHIPTAAEAPHQGVSNGNEPSLSEAGDRNGQGKAQ